MDSGHRGPSDSRGPRLSFRSRCRTYGLSSFLDVDGHGRAGCGGLTGVLGLCGRRVVGQKDHDAVIVALVEPLAGVEYALARGDALVLVERHFHVRAAP